MQKLLTFLFAVLFVTSIDAKSPHGDGFKIDCGICHTTGNWTNIKKDGFKHDKTGFPLVGQHKSVGCQKCHPTLVFSEAKTECSSCHEDIHQQTVGDDCERCHTTNSWIIKNVTQIHLQSGFALTGKHAQLDCYQCHKSASLLRFDPMKSECFDCHSQNYYATTNPPHVASNFPKDCSLCHNSNDWSSATFNHNNTNFPLTGAHIGVACATCHAAGYAGIPTTCVSCHLPNFNATTNPNHTTAKFSTDCQTCHTTTAWSPSTFNHTTNTTFPLTGAHIGVACATCHTAGYAGIPTTCVSCHLPNFNATTNPNHTTAKFSTDCQNCHTTTAWSPSTFNHTTSTSFPLTGAHIGVACVTCHTNGYGAIPTTCVSCHLPNYNATTDPNHIAAKFSTDCQTCHNTTAWNPSTFNHNTATSFPLTGGHIGVDCIKCHTSGYAGISTDCVSCHLTEYNATTNPNHKGANFPTTCETCHSTTNWTSSTFSHTSYFPISSGNHNVSCTTCHTNPANYGVFSCVTSSCHGNAHHQDQGSAGCYSCHPTGRSD